MAVSDDSQVRKRKMALLGVSSILLVAMVAAVAVGVNNENHSNGSGVANDGTGSGISASQRNVEMLCQPTDYQERCKETLSPAAKNTTDPKELIKAEFRSTMEELKKHIHDSDLYKELAKDNMTRQAMDVCNEVIGYAVDSLNRSIDKIDKFEFIMVNQFAYDLKVWLSAAITHQRTCLDAFEHTNTDAGLKMAKVLNSSMELSSIALDIVTGVSELAKSFNFNFRKLLSSSEDGIPSWASEGQRRLLQATTTAGTGAPSGAPAQASSGVAVQVPPGASTPSAATQTTTPVGQDLMGPNGIKVDAVVAQDGSGQYSKLNDALKVVPRPNTKPFVIYVKAGIYKEYVNLEFGQDHVTIIGDGPTKTRFTGNKNYKDGITTYLTSTFGVNALYFTARDIGIENTAGPTKYQAVALRVTSDYAIFHNCQFDGYQDTLYAQSNRQFYRDCTISGTIDFVFGAAAAVFQNCKLVLRKPLDNQQCIVLAGGRDKADQTGALVMQKCHFTTDPEFFTAPKKVKAFMGRPWRPYARTVIMDSQLDNVFENEGYQSWIGTLYHETCTFYEYNNKGAVATAFASRVQWPSVKQINAGEAMQFYPQKFFELYRDPAVASITGAVDKDQWILNSGVPYSPGPM